MSDNPSDIRPVAESFLTEASKEGRGKLKIFLGAAPGVGKTYAMLQAAHERRNEGVDVVIGVVETHGRAETQKLLEGLDLMPRKKISYKNHEFEEMDLEAILARKPQLILVDELAHTNVPGSIHEKRYQDIEILLQNQIDVYTTVNIQHLESLNDVIQQITKIKVRETLPDHVLKSADEIELVDLPPKELIRRLSEGKVYVKDQARKAIRHFFSPSNLTALRELALRHTAEQVDDQMLLLMQQQAIKGPWPTRDRILVCIDDDSHSEDLVRTASRISARRRAPLIALYIETPSHYMLSDRKKEQIYKTFQLAENLGAETVTVSGRDKVSSVLEYARNRNVTQIVVGQKTRSRVMQFLKGSVTHNLIRKSGDIDIYVINSLSAEEKEKIPRKKIDFSLSLYGYIRSLIAFLIVSIAAFILSTFLNVDHDNLELIFLPAVIYSSLTCSLLPSIIISFLAPLTYDYFLGEPLFKLTMPLQSHFIIFSMLIATSVLLSNLAKRAKTQALSAEKKEQRTQALYTLSKEMAGAIHIDDVLAAIVVKLDSILNAETMILLPDENKKDLRVACPPEFEFDEKEHAASLWSYEHEEMAGKGTDTLASAERLYMPLRTQRGIVGILGIKTQELIALKDVDFRRLLEALAAQAALAIERAKLAEEMEEAIISKERESLRSILLSSISFDLKTPLISVIAAVSSLRKLDKKLDKQNKTDLIEIIHQDIDKLTRFISNLLEMIKIESGSVIPKMELIEIKSLLSHSLRKNRDLIEGYEVKENIENNLPLIKADFTMMTHVFSNLIENAVKYSARGSEIILHAKQVEGEVVVELRDKGISIPEDELEKVFDKFYRLRLTEEKIAGTGLGLSLCKAIVEAHDAKIRAMIPDDAEGGTIIQVTFPANLTRKIKMKA